MAGALVALLLCSAASGAAPQPVERSDWKQYFDESDATDKDLGKRQSITRAVLRSLGALPTDAIER
jgi:hypothetical protein